MNDRTRFTGFLTAIVLLGCITASAAGGQGRPKRAVAPPSLSKLADAPVFAPLPDGRMIAVFLGSEANGPAVQARYSSDGGRRWSEKPVPLRALPKDLGGWGLHNVLVDHKGELHLFLTNDAKTSGKGLYQMRFDVYHLGSTDGRKAWKAPVLVRKGYYGSMQSVVELKGGRIILPVCYLTPRVWGNRGEGFDAFTDMGRFSSGVVYSDDRGDTWRRAAIEFKVPSPYSREEVRLVFPSPHGVPPLVCSLAYAAGLRLLEAFSLRVKDVHFLRQEVLLRDGKGQKDRVTLLPAAVGEPLRTRLGAVWRSHERPPDSPGGARP